MRIRKTTARNAKAAKIVGGDRRSPLRFCMTNPTRQDTIDSALKGMAGFLTRLADKNVRLPFIIEYSLKRFVYFSFFKNPSSSIVLTMRVSTIDAASYFNTSGRVRPISARIVFIPSKVG
jgi:hypothetical protein